MYLSTGLCICEFSSQMPHSLNVYFYSLGIQDFKTMNIAKNGWTAHPHPSECVVCPFRILHYVLHLWLNILSHASVLTSSWTMLPSFTPSYICKSAHWHHQCSFSSALSEISLMSSSSDLLGSRADCCYKFKNTHPTTTLEDWHLSHFRSLAPIVPTHVLLYRCLFQPTSN